MHMSTKVLIPADDPSLVTLGDAKIALGLSATDTSKDEQLLLMIRWASEEISVMANRVFAREKVIDRYRDFGDSPRMFLSHYPVAETDIEDVSFGDGMTITDFELDERTGLIYTTSAATWSSPLSITYTGGYDVPFETPMGLAQAAHLLTKEAYYSALRGDASVRMVAHKESRIIYFDPSTQLKALSSGGAGGSGSATRRAVMDFVKKYTNFYI